MTTSVIDMYIMYTFSKFWYDAITPAVFQLDAKTVQYGEAKSQHRNHMGTGRRVNLHHRHAQFENDNK